MRTDKIVMGMAGLLSKTESALLTKTNPNISRINMRPIPGEPPANVEYKRRNGRTSLMRIHFPRFPKRMEPYKEVGSSLF